MSDGYRTPTRLVSDDRLRPRCHGCGRLLAELATAPWIIRCDRCSLTNVGRVDGAVLLRCDAGHDVSGENAERVAVGRAHRTRCVTCEG